MFYVLGFLLIAFCKHVNEPFAMLMVGRISDGFAIGLVSTREVEREAHLDPDPDPDPFTDTDTDPDTDTDTDTYTDTHTDTHTQTKHRSPFISVSHPLIVLWLLLFLLYLR